MASMQLLKASYSFGATKNFSESHQEYSNQQSNYGNNSWADDINSSGYNSQAHGMSGRSMHSYGDDAYGHSVASKSTNYAKAQCAQSSPSFNVVQSGHKRQESHKSQQWAGGSPNCASPTQSAHSEFSMHNEEHMMGSANQGWARKPTQLSGSTQANQYGVAMHTEDHRMGNMEQGWANRSNQGANQYGQTRNNNAHMMGNVEQGWTSGARQNSSANLHGLVVDDTYDACEQDGWGPRSPVNNMGHGANFSGPNQINNPGLNMYKDEHVMEKSDRVVINPSTQLPGPIQGNQYGANGGFGNQSAKYSGANQIGYSGNNNGYGSAHGTAQNGFGSAQANHSTYGAAQKGYGAAQVNHSSSAYGAAQNGFGAAQVNHSSAYGAAQNGFGAAQANHSSAYGAAQNGFGAAQGNQSAHGSYNYQHQEEDHGVHDILDDILAKYPAHNVSGGQGNNWAVKPSAIVAQKSASSYAKQQSFSGPAQYGNVSQSSSNKFEMKKEMKAGYNNGCGF